MTLLLRQKARHWVWFILEILTLLYVPGVNTRRFHFNPSKESLFSKSLFKRFKDLKRHCCIFVVLDLFCFAKSIFMYYQHHQPGCVYHLEQQMWKKFTYDWKFIISNGSTYLKYILRSEFRTTLLMAEGLALFWTKNWIRILQKKAISFRDPWLTAQFILYKAGMFTKPPCMDVKWNSGFESCLRQFYKNLIRTIGLDKSPNTRKVYLDPPAEGENPWAKTKDLKQWHDL